MMPESFKHVSLFILKPPQHLAVKQLPFLRSMYDLTSITGFSTSAWNMIADNPIRSPQKDPLHLPAR